MRQLDFDSSGPCIYDTTFVVLDCETTGLSPQADAITELAAIKIFRGETISTFQTLINPNQKMSARIVAMTGITNEELQRCPSIEEVLPTFLEFLSDHPIVGHNVSFDISFLNNSLENHHYPKLLNQVFDTLKLAKRLIPNETPNYKLSTLSKYINSNTVPNHRAFADVQATAEVFHYLVERSSSLGISGINDLASVPSPIKRNRYIKRSLSDDAPKEPGIYAFISAQGALLYIGKSKNIKSRLRSYFISDSRKRMNDMIKRTDRIEYIVTPSAFEARIAEIRILQNIHSQYNIADIRTNRMHYVYFDMTYKMPVLKVTKKYLANCISYGPFTNKQIAQNFCDAINISLTDNVDKLEDCFTDITSTLLSNMIAFSDELKFEKAKRFHDFAIIVQKWMNRFIAISCAASISKNKDLESPQITNGRPVIEFRSLNLSQSSLALENILRKENDNSNSIPSLRPHNFYISNPDEFRERLYTANLLA